MKIKRKVQKNLPQLIEWAGENWITNQIIRADKQLMNVQFDVHGDFCTYGFTDINTTFTVEVEEEITEDTKFRHIVFIDDCDLSASYEDNSINDIKYGKDKEFHAYIDGEFKLIWRDGKLVE